MAAMGHKETSTKGFHSATINLSEFRRKSQRDIWGGLSSMQPETRYAKSGDVHIAYQVFGEGALDLVFIPPFFSNVEVWWDEPDYTRALTRLGNYAKVLIFDKRGTGMSDRVAELPGMEQRIDDLRAVMDAAGMEQAAMLGVSEGGSMAALFAATYPAGVEPWCLSVLTHVFRHSLKPRKNLQSSSNIPNSRGAAASARTSSRPRVPTIRSSNAGGAGTSGLGQAQQRPPRSCV